MKALVVNTVGKYQLEDVDIPCPGSGEVLVQVEFAAQNPADWPDLGESGRYVGERVAGMVHGGISPMFYFSTISTHTLSLPKGAARNGAFAEFLIAQAELLFHLPDEVSLEDGAQIAVAAMSACLGLYQTLKLPTPYDPPTESPTAIVVWSGATAVGRYVIQLAKLAGMRVFVTASPKQYDMLRRLGANDLFDYSDSFTGRDIFEASGGTLKYAVDCWSEGITPYQASSALSKDGGHIATVLPYLSRKKNVETTLISAYAVYGKDIVFPFPSTADLVSAANGKTYAKLISKLLAEGKLQLGPVKLFPNGLSGVVKGMEYSRLGKVHGEKIVYRIADTPGLRG
ncbi:hypothetical protein VNI00_011873 [Paramarasmius palmivorus]|uniref:Enoyl reductase (ER) domain-containing protein n=1 Tax=Paramarasmius palmivorus TaxID=297713 RepID=A0AAW0C955_9AGAR